MLTTNPKGRIPSHTALHLEPMKRIPWKLLLWLVGLGPLLGLAGLVGLARMGDLPETEALANPKTDFATRVYSFDGKVLGRYYTENRSDARFETLPPHLVEALTSTEDARSTTMPASISLPGARHRHMGKRGGGRRSHSNWPNFCSRTSRDTSFLSVRCCRSSRSGPSRPAWNATTPGELLYLNRYIIQAVARKCRQRLLHQACRNSPFKNLRCWWAC